ncbi:MAG: glycosyltransferase family 39 protein [Oscillochloridaceae bacterium umkhey_bin13]
MRSHLGQFQFLRSWIFHVAILIALALGLLALKPNASPFWADEAYTVLAVRAESWPALIQINLRNEETPPLYFVLARSWALFWGDSREASLRLLSTIAFVGCIPLIALLGTQLWSRSVGLTAALLLAINPFALYYAQEARAYVLAVFLSLLLALAAVVYVQRPGRWPWLASVLSGTALCYTSYFGGLTVAGLGLAVGWLLLYRAWHFPPTLAWQTRWGALLGWIGVQLVVLLLLLPWIPAVQYQIVVAEATTQSASRNLFAQVGTGLLALITAFPNNNMVSLILVVLAILQLLLGFLWVTMLATWTQRIWLTGGLLIPVLAAVLIFQGDSQFTARYLLLAQPWLLLALAAAALEVGQLQRYFVSIGRGLLDSLCWF